MLKQEYCAIIVVTLDTFVSLFPLAPIPLTYIENCNARFKKKKKKKEPKYKYKRRNKKLSATKDQEMSSFK